MARFRFRLRTPLRYARIRRAELRRELAAHLLAQLEVGHSLRQIQEQLQQARHELHERSTRGIEGAELQRISRMLELQRQRAGQLAERHAEMREQEANTRGLLREVMRQIQVLERQLREAHAAYRQQLARREQAEIDDLTLIRRVGSRPSRSDR
ncbi:MAG: hypothetical protein JSV80_05670 [Acidobacteriota bacterium]|nr:MAG: hypothetical protein JSV80_05670 [Acidobacteriota bacterium]